MNMEMVGALAQERQREIIRQANRQRHTAQGEPVQPADSPGRHAWGRRIPRYHLSWSRTSLSPAAAGGPAGPGARAGRSWVIVISATKGL